MEITADERRYISMESGERLWAALNRKELDRPPIDFGTTNSTGISIVAYRNYLKFLGKDNRDIKTLNLMQQLADVDEDILELLGCDTRIVVPKFFSPKIENLEDGAKEYEDEWGMRWRMVKGGHYYDLVKSSLADIDDLDKLSKAMRDIITVTERIAVIGSQINEIRARKKAVFLKGFVPGVMEFAAWLRGYEQFFTDLYADPEIAEAILEFACDVKVRYWEAVLTEFGDLVDVINESDDLGSQTGPLIAPKMYREVLKPLHRRIIETVRKYSRAKVFLHTCGAVYDFIPDLIDVGFDIINPLQYSAQGMDLSALKKNFGHDIIFWGGVVDTQEVLPRGSRESIMDEVKRNLDILIKDGGFVFAQVHNIQPDVPPESIQAMFDAFYEYCEKG